MLKKTLIGTVVGLLLLMLGGAVVYRLFQGDETPGRQGAMVVPVEAVAIERGPIEHRRVYSGTLEATASFVVAPKVAGRIERLSVDLSDTVQRGQVVAELDDDEYEQAVAQAVAEAAVAKANQTEAHSRLTIAQRERDRVQTLRERGIASDTQFDSVQADLLAAEAALAVAEAQVARAASAVKTAEIRQGYAQVTATWTGGNDSRVVAERFADEGDTVSANTPLMTIVELDPVKAVTFVTERDYSQLAPGQPIVLTTDAYPGRTFAGKIERIAPVFRQGSRQARVEITVPNPGNLLKPGMFIRAEVVLARVEDAVIVPVAALSRRAGEQVLFIVSADGQSVAKRVVTVGVQQGDMVQVTGEGIVGKVVTLGQQLLEDGSAIRIPTPAAAGRATGGETPAAEGVSP